MIWSLISLHSSLLSCPPCPLSISQGTHLAAKNLMFVSPVTTTVWLIWAGSPQSQIGSTFSHQVVSKRRLMMGINHLSVVSYWRNECPIHRIPELVDSINLQAAGYCIISPAFLYLTDSTFQSTGSIASPTKETQAWEPASAISCSSGPCHQCTNACQRSHSLYKLLKALVENCGHKFQGTQFLASLISSLIARGSNVCG